MLKKMDNNYIYLFQESPKKSVKSPEAEKVAKDSPAKVEETTPEKTSDKGSVLLQFRHFVLFWYGKPFNKSFKFLIIYFN